MFKFLGLLWGGHDRRPAEHSRDSDPALSRISSPHRILYDQSCRWVGQSVCVMTRPERFLLDAACGRLVNRRHHGIDRDSNAIDPKGRAVYLNDFIHSEIYKPIPSQGGRHSQRAVIPSG